MAITLGVVCAGCGGTTSKPAPVAGPAVYPVDTAPAPMRAAAAHAREAFQKLARRLGGRLRGELQAGGRPRR